MVTELDERGFDEAVKSGLVAVDFWAPWCMPCRVLAPVVEDLAGEYGGRISFYKLNIDEHRGPAVKHQVMSIPTLLVFKDGAVVDRIVGAVPKDKIKRELESHL